MTRILLLLALGFTAIGQTNEEPYFALQSNATFAVGEQPKVDLTSVDAGTLEFRVYKVNDPVAFFGKLEDPHQFGGRAPKPPLQKSFLETFHRTKHALRVDAVQFLHDQFSMKTIAAYQAFRTPKVSGKGGGAVEFATPPLLNPQQLVAAWKQSVATKGRFDTAPVNVGTGEDLSILELTRLVMEVIGYDAPIVTDPSKPDGTPRKLLDVSKLDTLGWRATTPLREGIARTYAAFLAA